MGSYVKISFMLLLFGLQAAHAQSKNGKDPGLKVPIPVGQSAVGVKIPYYGGDGRLQMNFQMASAERVSDKQLVMKALKLETYGENGRKEMTVDMPVSVLDLDTRIISSASPSTIACADFVLTGATMRFNTISRQGDLTGEIKMLIYNLKEVSANGSD